MDSKSPAFRDLDEDETLKFERHLLDLIYWHKSRMLPAGEYLENHGLWLQHHDAIFGVKYCAQILATFDGHLDAQGCMGLSDVGQFISWADLRVWHSNQSVKNCPSEYERLLCDYRGERNAMNYCLIALNSLMRCCELPDCKRLAGFRPAPVNEAMRHHWIDQGKADLNYEKIEEQAWNALRRK